MLQDASNTLYLNEIMVVREGIEPPIRGSGGPADSAEGAALRAVSSAPVRGRPPQRRRRYDRRAQSWRLGDSKVEHSFEFRDRRIVILSPLCELLDILELPFYSGQLSQVRHRNEVPSRLRSFYG